MTENLPASAARGKVGANFGAPGRVDVLTKEQLDERIRRLMEDLSARQPEVAAALEDAVWLRYGIDL